MNLEGSCRCGSVGFSVVSHTPYPYMRCYCSICRKCNGAGGFGINICGQYDTLQVQGEKHIKVYHAMVPSDETGGGMQPSTNARSFCSKCGSHLWNFDPAYPEWCYPYASSIDTDLPTPPQLCHIMLASKASWVEASVGPKDETFDDYPKLGIEEWHKKHKLYISKKKGEVGG